jgi:transglutaminase-like putative cysteine protease
MRRVHRIAIWAAVLAGAILPFARVARAAPDLPPLDPTDLKLKDNPAEPGAAAMYLYREEIVNNKNLEAKFEQDNYRLKIFTEEGKKYATIEVAYVKDVSNVRDIHGRTIHPDGTVIEFDGQVLDKTVVKAGDYKVQVKAFNLPDVTPGSIIEYGYKVQSKFSVLGAGWDVQENLYTRHAHFVFVPYGMTIPFSLRWRGNRLENVAPYKQNDGSWALDIENIPGVAEEDYTLPQGELTSWVRFYYSSNALPSEPKEFWDMVAKGWAASDDIFIGNNDAIRKLGAQTVNASDSAEEKLRKLYARVQQIHNTTYDPAKTPQEEKREKAAEIKTVEDIVKRGFATRTSINRLYVALARAAGFDARLVWVRSRTDSLFVKEITETTQLNRDLVFVNAGGKEYYLDPGNMFCPFGLVPWYESGTAAFRPTKNGAEFVVTPATPSSDSLIERKAQLSLEPEGSLSGTLAVRFTGQRAFVRRAELHEQDETGRKKSLEDEIKGWLPSDAKFELTNIINWDKIEEPLVVQGKITLPNIGQVAGKRLLLPLGLYLSSQRQLFDPATRKQDIYFPYPSETTDEFSIQLPAGWQPSTVPAPLSINPGGGFRFEISTKQVGNEIQIHRHFVIGGMLYSADSYPQIRDFFHSTKSSDDQQLILQAAPSSSRNQDGSGRPDGETAVLPRRNRANSGGIDSLARGR